MFRHKQFYRKYFNTDGIPSKLIDVPWRQYSRQRQYYFLWIDVIIDEMSVENKLVPKDIFSTDILSKITY